MATVNPYLIFNGNCEEAFNFYKSVFGGEFTYMGRFKDMPGEKPVSDSEKDLVIHVSLPLDKDSVLMGSDTTESAGKVNFGNNIKLSLNTSGKEEADKLFNALSAGGKIIMPMGDTFWGAYFGMCTDKFDINWMINFDKK